MKSVLDASGLTANDVDKQRCVLTTAGRLSCKKILFSPWVPDSKEGLLLENSIRQFLRTTVECATQAGYDTMAFPALGKLIFVDLICRLAKILDCL
jgi:hypothetical protein